MIEKIEENEEEWWKEGRGERMRRINGELMGVCSGKKIEEGQRGESCGFVCGWVKIRARGKICGGWERKSGRTTKL